jgi:hypothetical protein
MYFAYCKCKIEILKINNEMHVSLFIGLALSTSLYVALFYIHTMRNACNPKPNYEDD